MIAVVIVARTVDLFIAPNLDVRIVALFGDFDRSDFLSFAFIRLNGEGETVSILLVAVLGDRLVDIEITKGAAVGAAPGRVVIIVEFV